MRKFHEFPFAAALFACSLVFAGFAATGKPAQRFEAVTLEAPPATSAMSARTPDGEAADAAITANVKSAIASSVGTGAAQVNVETRAAVVTLSGEATSAMIRLRVREAAWTVSGVVDVIDRLEVRSIG
jgi:osmotically-inducible protein OsmY